jgi:hypothetical protein
VGSYYLFAMFKPVVYYALLSETLHGLTFALLWAATMARAQALVKGGYVSAGAATAVAASVSALGRTAGSLGSGFALQAGISIENVWNLLLLAMAGLFVIWTIAACILTNCTLHKKHEIKGL